MTVRFVLEARAEFLDAIRYYEEAEHGLAGASVVILNPPSGICANTRRFTASETPHTGAST